MEYFVTDGHFDLWVYITSSEYDTLFSIYLNIFEKETRNAARLDKLSILLH